ncbi:hypothetical protein E2C01_100333 [Portunus trituberculatus]|uniref:Uncharacterized protein n=1 Tax=Portunus trituberculatus TaxID=210409 RepID=A0A5B7KJ79_PORTR|nr:hypothetical protein [Portunus trituberculatus]
MSGDDCSSSVVVFSTVPLFPQRKEEWRRLRAGNRSVCWDGDNGAGGGLASGTGGGLGYGKACLWTPFGGPQCLGVCGAGRFGVRGEELLHRRPPWSLRRWDFYRSSLEWRSLPNQMEKSHSSSVTGGVTSTSVQEEEGMGAIAEREHM